MDKYILEMKNITKEFPGVRALDDVSFSVRDGEIRAICGENGAGKSTLMNVLSGVFNHNEYEGDIYYKGELCQFNSIRDSEEKGIVIIHQELALSPFLSIAENVFLGNERKKFGIIDWEETRREAHELLERVGLPDENVDHAVGTLGVGKQQLIEIAKALGKNADLLILDEPTAALNDQESRHLLDLLLQLKEQGMTCIIISHKINELSYVADAITILRDGQIIETLEDEFSEDRIIKGMVGRALTDRYPERKDVEIGDVVFEVKNWNAYHPLDAERQVLKDININVRAGEVVGLAGLMGSGRTELAMSIFGRSYGQKISGELYINGKEVELNTVRQAIDHGLAYVSEDRKQFGLVLMHSVKFNESLAALPTLYSNKGVIDEYKEEVDAKEYSQRINLKAPSIESRVENLSGGNQQKVVLAKWMMTLPSILILDEPTRGIDVGAKYEIHSVINEVAASGKAVIIISSEMPEIIGTCDRTYVLNEGRVVGELMGDEITQEAIMGRIMADYRDTEA